MKTLTEEAYPKMLYDDGSMQIARSIFRAPKINNPSVAKQMAEGVNADKMHSFVVKLVGRFNNRYAKTNQGLQASNWIRREWENIIGIKIG